MQAQHVLASLGMPPELSKWSGLVKLSPENLKVTPKGQWFVIELNVSGLSSQNALDAINKVKEFLEKSVGATVVHARAHPNKIVLFIKGSPINWTLIFSILPAILRIVGIVLIGITIWQVVTSLPGWAWATLIIGLALIYLTPSLLSEVRKKMKK